MTSCQETDLRARGGEKKGKYILLEPSSFLDDNLPLDLPIDWREKLVSPSSFGGGVGNTTDAWVMSSTRHGGGEASPPFTFVIGGLYGLGWHEVMLIGLPATPGDSSENLGRAAENLIKFL